MKRWKRLVGFIVTAISFAGCAVPAAEDGADPENVGKSESELPILPICTTASFGASYSASSPFPSSTSGHVEESIDLWGIAGDRDDVAWVERSISAPSSLYRRVTASANVDVSTASVELEAVPLAGYSSGGVNLLLEVKDGARVLCSQRVVLLERSTPAGGIDQALAPTTRTLSCSFDSSGLTSAPVARTSLETWATIGGFSTAYIRASGQVTGLTETKCMRFTF
ncbi:MAG: hypothetical protein ACXWUG_03380 [Polyangiales bacterium]